jgi:aminoglycoside phosphotransferase (APT) family kinase protein
VSEEYEKHLASLHDAWATPPSVVAGLIADVSDTAVVNIRRVIHGEQNEVYDVTLAGAPSLIVRISHSGAEAFEGEAWVLGECAARGIRAPRVHGLRRVEVEGEPLAAIVIDRVQGDRLCDVDLGEAEARRVLGEVGAWLRELHAIPVEGFGYLDGRGVGKLATLDDWLTGLTGTSPAFEEAGRSVGLAATTIRAWLREIVDSFRAARPRVSLIHNDLLAGHVMVHDGSLSGIIDFGEVAAEPAANDFAKWDFVEGERFPVEWIRDGYRDASLFQPPNDRTYQALWLANGLWRLRWYYETGYRLGAVAARDRLSREPSR